MKRSILAALCAAAVAASAQTKTETSAQGCSSVSKDTPREWTCLTGRAADAKPGRVVLRDAESWGKFWSAATARAEAPVVAFKTQAVVVAVAQSDGDKATFSAVKVAAGTDDKAAVRAAVAFASAAKDEAAGQSEAESRVARLLKSLSGASQNLLGGVSAQQAFAGLGGFDGRAGGGLRDAVAAPGPLSGLLLAQARCTPGVDCPSTPQNGPNCTPGVDCPGGQQPGQGCTPGVDCPGGGGRTPLPPNYQPRPSGPPSRFPPVGDPTTYDNSVASGWYLYTDYFGRSVEGVGSWSSTADRARVDRGGSEVGNQGTFYTADLTSRSERPVYRVYWRYVGTNCDPNDAGRCLNWGVQYARFIDRYDRDSSHEGVDVRFNDNGQRLLPWERETISVSYDGSRVGYDLSGAAFRYAVNGPIVNQQTGRALLELTAGDRVRRQPESDKVIARLEKVGGQLQISVIDRRASFYAGEPLEISFQVKKESGHWYSSDKVVAERSQRDPVRVSVNGGQEAQTAIPVSNTGSGTYYITGWSFRRAQSKISSDGWIGQSKGDKVSY